MDFRSSPQRRHHPGRQRGHGIAGIVYSRRPAFQREGIQQAPPGGREPVSIPGGGGPTTAPGRAGACERGRHTARGRGQHAACRTRWAAARPGWPHRSVRKGSAATPARAARENPAVPMDGRDAVVPWLREPAARPAASGRHEGRMRGILALPSADEPVRARRRWPGCPRSHGAKAGLCPWSADRADREDPYRVRAPRPRWLPGRLDGLPRQRGGTPGGTARRQSPHAGYQWHEGMPSYALTGPEKGLFVSIELPRRGSS